MNIFKNPPISPHAPDPAADILFATESNTDTDVITLEDIEKMKTLLDNMPPVPPMPRFHMMQWPIIQRRTHRKSRINKKWARRYGYKDDTTVDDGTVYEFMASGVIAAYPKTYYKLIDAFGAGPGNQVHMDAFIGNQNLGVVSWDRWC